jgi:hypothetical protein
MATLTIRLVTSNDIISALIRDKTWCAYSHVEFILDDGTTLGAHADGGVRIRPIDYAVFTAVKVITITVTEEQKAAVLAFAHAQVGKAYDMGAIAGIVVAALEQGNVIHRIADNVDRIVPRDVLIILSSMFGDAK